MEVPGDRAPRAAGDGGNLAARYYFNDDHVQKLLPGRRRRAAEEEDEKAKKYMDRMCVPLLVPATSLVWVLFVIITRGLAWTSSAAQMTGEQHARAVIFHLCSVLAFAQAAAVVALLCRYLLLLWTTAAAARRDAGRRTLAAVRFMFVAAVVLMVMSVCVGIDADWRIGAAVFLGVATITGVCVLYIFGKLV